MDKDTEKRFMDKVDVIYDKVLQLPCSVHVEKISGVRGEIKGIRGQIKRVWWGLGLLTVLVGGFIAKSFKSELTPTA